MAFYKQLLQVASEPDTNRPELQHARNFVEVESGSAGPGRRRREPPPRGWLATASHLGPGLIISAAIVGSGELIVTPKVGAASGFSDCGSSSAACIVKVFVQVELARLAIVERVTTLAALNSVPGPRFRVSWPRRFGCSCTSGSYSRWRG